MRTPFIRLSLSTHLSQSLPRKARQHKRSLMNISIIILINALLLLGLETPQWILEISVRVLATDHESNLSGWVCGNGGVGILDVWEDCLAVLLELCD